MFAQQRTRPTRSTMPRFAKDTWTAEAERELELEGLIIVDQQIFDAVAAVMKLEGRDLYRDLHNGDDDITVKSDIELLDHDDNDDYQFLGRASDDDRAPYTSVRPQPRPQRTVEYPEGESAWAPYVSAMRLQAQQAAERRRLYNLRETVRERARQRIADAERRIEERQTQNRQERLHVEAMRQREEARRLAMWFMRAEPELAPEPVVERPPMEAHGVLLNMDNEAWVKEMRSTWR